MPTALELTREEWNRYRRQPEDREGKPGLSVAERRERERVLALVRRAAEALKARFNVRRVLLFGSLAHEAWYASDSDVDLAVQGLSADDYWRAWGVIEDIITERPVDLVDLDAAPDSLRRSIERDGIDL